jgi:hypothetical protein
MKARTRKRLVWLAVLVVAGLCASFVISLSGPKEPAFVSELNGRYMDGPPLLWRHGPQDMIQRKWTFKADFRTVRQGMEKELPEPDWKIRSFDMIVGDDPKYYVGWAFDRGNESFSVTDYEINGEIEVRYLRRPSWLEQKWTALRDWMGSR